MTPAAVQNAAGMLDKVRRIQNIAAALTRCAQPVVYLTVLDGDGEGRHFGDESVPVLRQAMIRMLLALREAEFWKLRALGVAVDGKQPKGRRSRAPKRGRRR